jgi:hypothetical protein
MARQIPKTQKIVALLRDIVGQDSDLSQLAVFEWVAFNTLPVKQYSIFDGSNATKGMLTEMAEFVKRERFVPLLTMHDTNKLPIGRVFEAEVVDRRSEITGETISELRVLFYLSNNTEKGRELIDAVDLGIIDEVSIGAQAQHIRCSSCGFDYADSSEGSRIMNWIDQTCDQGHVIGEDGVHLILDGLNSWKELSLVNRGAAHKAKNVKPENSILASLKSRGMLYNDELNANKLLFAIKGKETQMNLSNQERSTLLADVAPKVKRILEAKDPTALVLHTSLSEDDLDLQQVKTTKDDLLALAAAYELANPERVEVQTLSLDAMVDLKAKTLVAEEKIVELAQVKTTLEAANIELKTQLEVALAAVQEHEAVKTEAALAAEFLKASAKNLLTAAGIKTEAVEDVAGLIEQIKQANATLSALPVGGVATLRLAADAEDPANRQSKASTSASGAFKSKK